jgi:hypothetical protein
MHPYPKPTKVQTNEAYFRKFGRRAIGTTISVPMPTDTEQPKEFTFMKWEQQFGNVIPEHYNQVVLMMTEDLEPYVKH